jgi:hypothetical protein
MRSCGSEIKAGTSNWGGDNNKKKVWPGEAPENSKLHYFYLGCHLTMPVKLEIFAFASRISRIDPPDKRTSPNFYVEPS